MNIIPSILTNTYDELHSQVSFIRDAVDWIQVDVADGEFVKNTTVGLKDVADGEFAGLSVEVHLMVKDPLDYLDDCERLNINRIIVHAEILQDLGNIISQVASRNMQVALALNPETGVDIVEKYIDNLNSLLLMSVHPGWQGQEFISDVLEKISQIRVFDPDIIIGLDGGVNIKNIEKISTYHPDYVIVGSGLWQSDKPLQTLALLKERVKAEFD